jgi:hypothetical protein
VANEETPFSSEYGIGPLHSAGQRPPPSSPEAQVEQILKQEFEKYGTGKPRRIITRARVFDDSSQEAG